MTYCVAIRNQAGLVFLSDSRTNAGVDQANTFRKMHVFEVPGERVMVLLTVGNLSISQPVASGLGAALETRATYQMHMPSRVALGAGCGCASGWRAWWERVSEYLID